MAESLKADFNDSIPIDNSGAAKYLHQDNFRMNEDRMIFPACKLKSWKIYLFTRRFHFLLTN
jgi:hypothetical protein